MSTNKIGASKVFYSPKAFDQFSGKTQMKKKATKADTVLITVDKEKHETAIKMIETMGKIEFWQYWAGTLSNPNYKGQKPWDIARDCAKWLRSNERRK